LINSARELAKANGEAKMMDRLSARGLLLAPTTSAIALLLTGKLPSAFSTRERAFSGDLLVRRH